MATRPARKKSALSTRHPLSEMGGTAEDQQQDQAAAAVVPEQQASTPEPDEEAAPTGGSSPARRGPANAGAEKPQAEIPQVSSKDAKRVGLYMSAEEHKWLGLARVEDGIDANTRMRAMFAIYRNNERFRKQVDRLAKKSP